MVVRSGERFVVDEASTPTWFIVAKKRGDYKVINGIHDFGFQPTDSSALGHAIWKLELHPELARKYAGYTLFPIPAHLSYRVPDVPR